ncbi:hypothetical protein WJX84_010195 [Apatococcus fuscideae]|uniref:Uncharacterized protein n=1 Tax=Apatococcus fuscideae TaxID=2026836 RepID=A0AAW1SXF8_9CHLO
MDVALQPSQMPSAGPGGAEDTKRSWDSQGLAPRDTGNGGRLGIRGHQAQLGPPPPDALPAGASPRNVK